MTDESVIYDIYGNIAYVTLNRPDVHNAFDEATIALLADIFHDLAYRDEVIAVVLKGEGKSFSAGGDLNWMKRAASYRERANYKDGLRLANMLHALYSLPQLTIACVQGAAMGGGMGLACCCDVVIATAHAKFALSEVKLGLIPATIGPYVMAALGPRHANRFFQTGERIDAEAAHRIGLVHELVADDAAMEEKLSGLLETIAVNGPKAMRAAKALSRGLTPPVTDGTRKFTARLIARVRAGAEAKEGLSAFLEKRLPAWSRKEHV